jgi:hypothetical protein
LPEPPQPPPKAPPLQLQPPPPKPPPLQLQPPPPKARPRQLQPAPPPPPPPAPPPPAAAASAAAAEDVQEDFNLAQELDIMCETALRATASPDFALEAGGGINAGGIEPAWPGFTGAPDRRPPPPC